MTIAVDVVSENLRTGTTSPQTWSHAGAASGVKGVLVGIMHGASSTDHVSACSYGGSALTRVQRNTDTATEPGAAEWWFLGSSVPQGTQTVSYTPGSTTDDIHAVCITLTAATNLIVQAVGGVNDNAANPSVALTYDGRHCMAFAAMYSGLTAYTSVTAGANCTAISTTELAGNFASRVLRQTTPGTADFTIAATSATDDVAFAVVAVGELMSWDVSLPAEAASASDSASASATLPASLTETGTSTDSHGAQLALPATVAEAASATDTVGSEAGAGNYSVEVAESANASELLAALLSTSASLSEALAATDTHGAQLALAATVSEAASAGDALSGPATYVRSIAEPVSATDLIASAATLATTLGEAASAADQISASAGGATYAVDVTEMAAAIDTLSAYGAIAVSLAESGTAADVVLVIGTPTALYLPTKRRIAVRYGR